MKAEIQRRLDRSVSLDWRFMLQKLVLVAFLGTSGVVAAFAQTLEVNPNKALVDESPAVRATGCSPTSAFPFMRNSWMANLILGLPRRSLSRTGKVWSTPRSRLR